MLSDRVLANAATLIPELGTVGADDIRLLAESTDDVNTLLDPIVKLVSKLKRGTAD